ncbi:hypothetical protein ATCC90586_004999 [Pythium insidiosum]|nr:hypothetical protein ATCC90586_004999 [Pythium insidiosum]
MDAILARLDPRQLRQFCVDAVRHELRIAHELIEKARVAAKRLEDVQDAAQRLRFDVFNDDDALRRELQELHAAHHDLGLSLARIQCAKASEVAPGTDAFGLEPRPCKWSTVKAEPSANSPPVTGERVFAQAIDLCHDSDDSDGEASVVSLSSVEDSESDSDRDDNGDETFVPSDTESDEERRAPGLPPPPASRKRRLSEISDATESTPSSAALSGCKRKLLTDLLAKMESSSSQSSHHRALLAAGKLALAQMRKPIKDRGAAWKALCEKTIAILLTATSSGESQSEGEDSVLVIVVEFTIQVLTKCRPDVRRKRLRLLLRVMTSADESTGQLAKSVAALQEYIHERFVIPKKEAKVFRQRLAAACSTVDAWEKGSFNVPDFVDKMDLLRDLMTKQFEAWQPARETRVAGLIVKLLEKMEAFRPGKLQDQRRETLVAWLEQCDATQPSPAIDPVAPSAPAGPAALSKKKKKKKKAKSQK